MPVVALLILSCICTVQAKTNIKRILCAAVSGFLLAIGWLIKATIIAIPAALTVIVFIYAVQKRKELKKQKIIELRRFATIIITGVLVCVSALITFNFYVDNQSIVEFDKTIKTPASYTIATGMVERPAACTRPLYGAWNYDTANLNNGTTQEKDEKFKTFIKEKLDELGFNGYMKFLIKKARWMTSEGHFCWLREGGGTADFSNPDANFLKSLFYNNGKHYMFFIHAANGLWIVVFLGLCLGMLFSWLRGFKQTDKFNADLFLCLSVFFIIVVLLFTEGRSRYLISFLPIFCIISANGYSRIIDSLRLISQEV
jgi:4-amino-4-deoxy-L-arabinose transferase-like glycosyltransferase